MRDVDRTLLRRNLALNLFSNIDIVHAGLDETERGPTLMTFQASYRLDGSRTDAAEIVPLRTLADGRQVDGRPSAEQGGRPSGVRVLERVVAERHEAVPPLRVAGGGLLRRAADLRDLVDDALPGFHNLPFSLGDSDLVIVCHSLLPPPRGSIAPPG